ncbi:MAG: insulinase family protein, partial [bacterium]
MLKKALCLPCVIPLFFLLALRTLSGELPSGIHYVVTETSFSPLQSVYALINVGSAYETQETSGLSHLLEHLLFDGTQKFTRSQLQQKFDDRGIYVNAFTREDYTAFLITSAPENIPIALDLLFQMLLESTLPQEEFLKEQKVVIEEMRKDRMNPVQALEENFLLSLPPSSPYRLPVIGTEETIRNISREKVWNFYRKYYTPENITLLTYGPLKQEEFLRIISEILPKHSQPGHKSEPVTPIPIPEKIVIKEKNGGVHYYLLFPSPLRSLKHLIAYEWFIQWATQKWKPEDFSAEEISFELFPYRHQPFIRIHLEFSREETGEKVTTEIHSRILGALLEKDVEQTAPALLQKIYAEKVFMSENVTYMGMWLADWLGRGLFVPLERYLDTIRQISFSEIRNILISEWERKPLPSAEDVDAGILPPRVVQRTLQNGLRIVAYQRPGSQVFAVNTLILHPLYHEPEGFLGLHTLLQMLLGKETDEYTPDEIEKITQEWALRIKTTDDPALPFDDYYFSPFFSYVRIETLKDYWRDSLRFLVSILRHSRFSEDIVAKNREMLQSLLQKYGTKMDEQLRDEATRRFFPFHPYGK